MNVMSGEANLNKKQKTYSDGHDEIVITRMLADIPGGVTLDTTGYKEGQIRKGHVVIREKLTGVCKPLEVKGKNYVTLPEGYVYKGVVISTTVAEDPRVGVMTQGQVNAKASPYPITEEIQNGLPLIEFF